MSHVLADLSDFIFLEHAPEKADVIFITGSGSPEPMERAAALWLEGWAPLLCPSGRFSIVTGRFDGPARKRELYPGPYPTEWAFMADIGARMGVPADCILREDQATYTMQNATFSREATDRRGLRIRKAILCCKAYHARRAYMYYQYAFPGTEFLVCPAEVEGIRRDNWYRSDEGIQKVLGEVSRCGQQFPELIPALARQEFPCL